jgi:hypothetical protein
VDKKPPGRGEKKKKESMEVVFVLAVVLFRFCSFQKKPGSARRLVVSLPCGKVWAKEKTPRTSRGRKRGREGKKEEAKKQEYSPRALALSWRQNPSHRERDPMSMAYTLSSLYAV